MLDRDVLLQDRYLIIDLIAQGGMGAVYKAKDQRLGNTVALKQTLVMDAYLRDQFRREAQILANLQHPTLPKVSDFFAEGDDQLLVMQFIPGPDLAELMAENGAPFEPTDMLRWADQLLEALQYLHTQKKAIIHRDIKPQNLKCTRRGDIILLDFGLAKGTPSDRTRTSTARSVHGYTLNYAPLEQIQGVGTNAASDLYALAATMYHLLTGVTPPDALERAAAKAMDQPDPLHPAHELDPQIPPTISEVLTQAMEINRYNRPATAAAMRQRLRYAAQRCGISLELPVIMAPPKLEDVEPTRVKPPSATASETLAYEATETEIQPPVTPIEPLPTMQRAPTQLAESSDIAVSDHTNSDASLSTEPEPEREAAVTLEMAPLPTPSTDWALLCEFSVESQNAWPLGEKRVLVWEGSTKILTIREGDGVVWHDGLRAPLRCVSRGLGDQWAVATWDGQVRCFTGGQLVAAVTLAGTVGDVQFCADRWVAGTWQTSLVSIAATGEMTRLVNVDMGVFRIAVRAESDRFAVADLNGGIVLYSGHTKVADLPALGNVSSLAFAGSQLIVLTGDSLITIGLDNRVGSPEPWPDNGQARLLPAPTSDSCLLLTSNGACRSLSEAGVQRPYFDFAEQTLLSYCRKPKCFTVARRGQGCAYYRDGELRHAWSEALTANLSADGRLVTVVFPDQVQLYEDLS